MSADKQNRPKARVAKGFRDIGAAEMRGVKAMLRTIEGVYESYGFEPVEQPFIEYTDALGKFLPDQDRPNEGVFSFQDDDEQWLSLRYDLTAPLARYVAENQQSLAMPFRSYRQGWVFRNEKPGPGRYRQFMQFDADTVGTASPAADAEVCMMAADTMEALGLEGKYRIRVFHRQILDGVLDAVGVPAGAQRLITMRAIDKFDRIGVDGLRQLLGAGRRDESGDFAKGAELNDEAIEGVLRYVEAANMGAQATMFAFDVGMNKMSMAGAQGVEDLEAMAKLFLTAGYSDRIRPDFSVVRGLEYYTGPVFECELLMEARNEDGQLVRFGSVGGGGRYDDLVARFTGQKVPATGFSIGVSRLYAALQLVGQAKTSTVDAPVLVTVMDKDRISDYQRLTTTLRQAGIRAEMYLGTSGFKAQMKYADRRGSPLVVIQGGDEKAKGEIQIKDMRKGAELAKGMESRADYTGQRLAQFSVPETQLVEAVKKALDAR
ncbi:histidine--tRNA ligase [soil metagenome]